MDLHILTYLFMINFKRLSPRKGSTKKKSMKEKYLTIIQNAIMDQLFNNFYSTNITMQANLPLPVQDSKNANTKMINENKITIKPVLFICRVLIFIELFQPLYKHK